MVSKKKETITVVFGSQEIKLKQNNNGVFQGKHKLCVDQLPVGLYVAYIKDTYLWQPEGVGKKPQTAVNRLERKLGSLHAKLEEMLYEYI